MCICVGGLSLTRLEPEFWYSFKLGIRLVSFRYQREKKASFPDPDGSDGVAVARHRLRRTLLLTAHLATSTTVEAFGADLVIENHSRSKSELGRRTIVSPAA